MLNDESIHEAVVQAAKLTAEAMKAGRKLMVCGNGGSAADSQHLVAEFVSRLTVDRPALRAIALTTDSSILTAIGNDYSYDNVFERQVEALGDQPRGVLGIRLGVAGMDLFVSNNLTHTVNFEMATKPIDYRCRR